MLQQALSFDDILLVPRFSDLSRKEVDLTSRLKESHFKLPFISSPMETVTENKMASAMNTAGGMGIIHRYNTVEKQASLVRKVALGSGPAAAAIGVTGDYLERARELVKNGATILCIDVAHGHHQYVKETLMMLKRAVSEHITIIAGNVATKEAFDDLSDWGADAIRVGIGGGSICSTRIQTGHGVPNVASLMDCAQSDRPAKLILDGGIKNSGDMVKALALGADFVMCGSLFAGTEESPGDIIFRDNELYKNYRGMASKEAQNNWKGRHSSFEGVSTMIKYKGSVVDVIDDLRTGVVSGLSYSGARTIKELQEKAQPIIQTSLGYGESYTHILKRSL